MELEKYSEKRLLFINKKECLSYKKGRLYYRAKIGKIKDCYIGSTANKVELLERALRREPRCAVKVDNNHFLVSFCGTVLNYDTENNTVVQELSYGKGMNNPLSFTSVRSEDGTTDVYFGEYISNKDRGPVAIYRRDGKKGHWSKVYEFPEKTILHIHNVIEDSYRKGFIILTGDSNSESGIWYADYSFTNVRPILKGKQQYRACVAFPIEEGIIYATDTPLEKNHIYRVIIGSNGEAENITDEYVMPGPCIFGTTMDNFYYFATSVEPDSSLPNWRYRLTYKLGKGVNDRYSYLIRRDKKGEYQIITRIKKDLLPMLLFQFGNILFPQNGECGLFIISQSTVKGHGVTYKILN